MTRPIRNNMDGIVSGCRRGASRAFECGTTVIRSGGLAVMLIAVAAALVCVRTSDAPAYPSRAGAAPTIVPTCRGDYAAAIVVEVETGTVLSSRNPDLVRSPASLTKLMTGLLVLEAIREGQVSLEDSLVTPKEVRATYGSRVHLWVGERVSIHDALAALFIASGNDAATALACHLGGSEEAFVRRMNERAGELGMYRTHFTNPHGLDNGRHSTNVSTARDMARLSRELLRHPLAMEISGMETHTIRGTQAIRNTNRLVGRLPGVNGLKTGYTSRAGFCLAAAAERNGLRIVTVLLGSPAGNTRFSEAAGLITRAFTEYQVVPMVREGQDLARMLMVRNGSPSRVRLMAGSDVSVLLSTENRLEVRLEVDAPPLVHAPVRPGARLGHVRVFIADSLAAEGPAVAASHVRRAGLLDRLGRHFGLGE